MIRQAAGNNAGAAAVLVVLLLLFLMGVAAYFIPLIIAALRHVPNIGSVAVVNTLLGWTFIGWVVALAMACRSAATPLQVNVYGQQPGQGEPPLYGQPPGNGQWALPRNVPPSPSPPPGVPPPGVPSPGEPPPG